MIYSEYNFMNKTRTGAERRAAPAATIQQEHHHQFLQHRLPVHDGTRTGP